MALPPVTLILGGARSGKSTHAEKLIEPFAPATYLATAEVRDDEMAERVRLHAERRGEGWTTVEEPLDLAGALKTHSRPGHPILVDCLTLWLTNVMLAEKDTDAALGDLVEALGTLSGPVVLVSNEVGLGIVPDNALARRFRDAAGIMNQRIAEAADRVVFVAAGLPMVLKNDAP